jgi:hypothetical protein
MNSENGNQPACQTPHVWAERWEMIEKIKDSEGGLTKRELFAAMAMQGLCAINDGELSHNRAAYAVEHADDLLAALDKSK